MKQYHQFKRKEKRDW